MESLGLDILIQGWMYYLKCQIKKSARQAKILYEKKIAKEARGNKRQFFRYVNSKLAVRPDITSSAFGRDMSRVLWLALRASHKCHKQAYGWPFGPAICKFYLKLKCLLKRHIWVFKRQQTCDEQTCDGPTDRPTDRPTCSKLMFFMLKVYKNYFYPSFMKN